jgi:hypothetical protein
MNKNNIVEKNQIKARFYRIALLIDRKASGTISETKINNSQHRKNKHSSRFKKEEGE